MHVIPSGRALEAVRRMMRMDLSVVIPSSPDRLFFLSSCIANVLRQTFKPKEIVVVYDKGKGKFFEDVLGARVVESDGHGLSEARNKGVEATSGDLIAFVDDDVVIADRNLFEKVVSEFESDERLGIYGVAVKPLFYSSAKLPDRFAWIFGCTDDGAVRPVGAFFVVRRKVFEDVGMFRSDLGRKGNLTSGEETDLILRAEEVGWKVKLDRSLKVHHLVFRRGWRYVLRRCFREGYSKAMIKGKKDVEKEYLKRYVKDPIGIFVLSVTVFGYLVGRVRSLTN